MRYYFQSFKAIPKRRKTVDDLVARLEIEKATRDDFDKNAEEESDNNTKAMWLGYWKQWQFYCSAWTTRIESICQSDYSLDLLNAHEKITIEEAFCICFFGGVRCEFGFSPSKTYGFPVSFLRRSSTSISTLVNGIL